MGEGIDPAVFWPPHLNAPARGGPGGLAGRPPRPAPAAGRPRRAARRCPGPARSGPTALPVAVGDFVDGYGGLHHATNMGRILRPDGPPLQPNWRHLPVELPRAGGHGGGLRHAHRAAVRVRSWATDGPRAGADRPPRHRARGRLRRRGGERSSASRCRSTTRGDHLFGVVLLNDWSARDVQAFEYQPLGPFLAKSFATSISHWVVPLEALDAVPGRRPGRHCRTQRRRPTCGPRPSLGPRPAPRGVPADGRHGRGRPATRRGQRGGLRRGHVLVHGPAAGPCHRQRRRDPTGRPLRIGDRLGCRPRARPEAASWSCRGAAPSPSSCPTASDAPSSRTATPWCCAAGAAAPTDAPTIAFGRRGRHHRAGPAG